MSTPAGQECPQCGERLPLDQVCLCCTYRPAPQQPSAQEHEHRWGRWTPDGPAACIDCGTPEPVSEADDAGEVAHELFMAARSDHDHLYAEDRIRAALAAALPAVDARIGTESGLRERIKAELDTWPAADFWHKEAIRAVLNGDDQ